MFSGAVDIAAGNVIQNNLKCLSEATDNLHTLFITPEPSYICIRFIYTVTFMISVLWKTQNFVH